MKKNVIGKSYQDGFSFESVDEIWKFTSSCFITGGGIKEAGGSNHITIAASVTNPADYAVLVQGDGTDVDIGKQALLSGRSGVYVVAQDVHVTNAGNINAARSDHSASSGIIVTEKGFTLDNTGTIRSEVTGVSLLATGSITNEKSGTITGSFAFMGSNTDPAEVHFINHGRVNGYYSGSIGRDDLTNDGIIQGDVQTNAGNDRIDMRGGILDGSLSGGTGNDTYLLSARSKIIENADEGTDTVKSSVSFVLPDNVEKLFLTGDRNLSGTGNDLDNRIVGNRGDNVLNGGGGVNHDTLTGGKGDDDFVFTVNDGQYVITDFENGHDRIGLVGFSTIHHFSDLDGHILKSGDGVLIVVSGAGGRSVLLEHTHLSDIDRHDFFFG